MSSDPNKKSARTFQCRDVLWETFEQMARELECSVDYLINEAMKQYARQRSYGSRTPFPAGPGASSRGNDAMGGMSGGSSGGTPGSFSVSSTGQTNQLGSSAGPAPTPGRAGAMPLPPPPGRATIAGHGGPPRGGLPIPPPARAPGGGGLPAPPSRATSSGFPLAPPSRGSAHAPAAPRSVPPPLPRGVSAMPPGMGSSMPSGLPPSMSGLPSGPGMGSVNGGAFHAPSNQTGALHVIYQGEKMPVNKDRFVIGRGKQSSDLTLKDPNVSRQHAMVEFQNGVYFMVDMGSTNGVEYNGQRIARKQIAEGDVYRICDHDLFFTYR